MRITAIAFAGLLLGTPAMAQEEQDQFYILQEDRNSIKTVILSSVDGGPTDTSVVILDVFKQPRSMLLQTLEFDCQNSTYAVTRISNGETESTKRGKSEAIPLGTQIAFVGNLVCAGNGQLERDLVINGTMADVAARVWDERPKTSKKPIYGM
jgi:hypothetical protein